MTTRMCVRLLKELRESFETEADTTGRPMLLLSAAVAAGRDNIDAAYEIPLMFKYVVFLPK